MFDKLFNKSKSENDENNIEDLLIKNNEEIKIEAPDVWTPQDFGFKMETLRVYSRGAHELRLMSNIDYLWLLRRKVITKDKKTEWRVSFFLIILPEEVEFAKQLFNRIPVFNSIYKLKDESK